MQTCTENTTACHRTSPMIKDNNGVWRLGRVRGPLRFECDKVSRFGNVNRNGIRTAMYRDNNGSWRLSGKRRKSMSNRNETTYERKSSCCSGHNGETNTCRDEQPVVVYENGDVCAKRTSRSKSVTSLSPLVLRNCSNVNKSKTTSKRLSISNVTRTVRPQKRASRSRSHSRSRSRSRSRSKRRCNRVASKRNGSQLSVGRNISGVTKRCRARSPSFDRTPKRRAIQTVAW